MTNDVFARMRKVNRVSRNVTNHIKKSLANKTLIFAAVIKK